MVERMRLRSRDVFRTTFEEGVVFSHALDCLKKIAQSQKAS
jgi:hypothetical protein